MEGTLTLSYPYQHCEEVGLGDEQLKSFLVYADKEEEKEEEEEEIEK